MALVDIRSLTDDELESHLNDTLNERERRQRLANVPAQVAALTAAFIADGGDRDVIVHAVQEPPADISAIQDDQLTVS